MFTLEYRSGLDNFGDELSPYLFNKIKEYFAKEGSNINLNIDPF